MHPILRPVLLGLAALLLPSVGAAQPDAPARPLLRDPAALAARYLGAVPGPYVPPLRAYQVGDSATFLVPRQGAQQPETVTASLLAISPDIGVDSSAAGLYLWAEDGVRVQAQDLPGFAALLAQAAAALAQRSSFGDRVIIGESSPSSIPLDRLPLPDIDNDPRVHVLYTRDLGALYDVLYNPLDSVPPAYAPGGFSNGREVLYLDTAAYAGLPLDDAIYGALIVDGLTNWYVDLHYGDRPAWLREQLVRRAIDGLTAAGAPPSPAAYLASPDVPLLRTPTPFNAAAVGSGQALWLRYLALRTGSGLVASLGAYAGEGLAPVQAALAARGLIDSETGAPMHALDLFADFTVANILDLPFGDGRYAYDSAEALAGQIAARTPLQLRPAADTTPVARQSVEQFGADYAFWINQGDQPVEVTVAFDGAPTAPLLALPATAPTSGEVATAPADERFYWSGAGPDRNSTLTRALDLRAVEGEVVLTFDAWFELSDAWNYAYVSVSTDDSATWQALPPALDDALPDDALPDDAVPDNRHGVAYGPGLTGRSTTEAERPFPALGVNLQGGTLISGLVADGAAAAAGVQVGDVIAGYEGEPWPGVPNVNEMLAQYEPGETLRLLIGRDQNGDGRIQQAELLDIPVTLDAHPTRRVLPPARWQPYRVDLSAYAGQRIALRFEYVSLPGSIAGDDAGIAIDNIAVEAIAFRDTGDAEGWTLHGWEARTNRVPQPWYVHGITTGQVTTEGVVLEPVRVRRWLSGTAAPPAAAGTWTLRVLPGEVLIVTVSAASETARGAATYQLSLTQAGA